MVSSDFLGFGGSLSDKLEKWGSLVTNRTNIGGLWVTNGKMVTNGKKVECPPSPPGMSTLWCVQKRGLQLGAYKCSYLRQMSSINDTWQHHRNGCDRVIIGFFLWRTQN